MFVIYHGHPQGGRILRSRLIDVVYQRIQLVLRDCDVCCNNWVGVTNLQSVCEISYTLYGLRTIDIPLPSPPPLRPLSSALHIPRDKHPTFVYMYTRG